MIVEKDKPMNMIKAVLNKLEVITPEPIEATVDDIIQINMFFESTGRSMQVKLDSAKTVKLHNFDKGLVIELDNENYEMLCSKVSAWQEKIKQDMLKDMLA